MIKKQAITRRLLIILTIVFIIIIIENGCAKKLPEVVKQTVITTLQASSITYTSAMSGGSITQYGTDSLLEKGICYGIAPTPTIADSVIISGNTSDTFNSSITGLSPNTAYYIRAFIKTMSGTFYGNEVAFKTSGGAKGMNSTESASVIYLAGGYTNDVFAIDAATGHVIWDKKLNATYCSSAIYTNGRIVVRDYNNTLTAFDTSGNIVWTRVLDGSQIGLAFMPVFADNGIVYCVDYNYTYAIYSNDGSLKWRANNGFAFTGGNGSLILRDNSVYVSIDEQGVFAFDAETGNLKWTNNYAIGIPIFFKDFIGKFDMGSSTFIFALDPGTGNLEWLSNDPPVQGSKLNEKYGRIYSMAGWVIDSASVSASTTQFQFLNSMKFFYNLGSYPGSYPDGSMYPILADSLAISPAGVCDAITGDLICEIPGSLGNYGFSGGTYLNHVFYYTTGEYEVYDPYTGGHWYSDLYAYDVIAKKQLWNCQIENTCFFEVEPCVVGNSGNVYRGAFTSR